MCATLHFQNRKWAYLDDGFFAAAQCLMFCNMQQGNKTNSFFMTDRAGIQNDAMP